MSFQDGWAALNLDKPARVPRTEYSAEMHWDLLKVETGIDVGPFSDDETKAKASDAFRRKWNFDISWSVMIGSGEFGSWHTSMGHAVYMTERQDFNPNVSSPFKSVADVFAFDPVEQLPHYDAKTIRTRFEDHEREQQLACDYTVAMTGTYVTCISAFIDLFGWDLFLEALGEDQERFGKLALRYWEWIGRYFTALTESDVKTVMVHDDLVWSSGPFVHPDWYRKFVFPEMKRFIRPLAESGKRVLFTSDGDYTAFFDDLVDCGYHGFAMEPMTDMALFASKYGKTHAFIGNADTRILLCEGRDAIRAEVDRCMAIGKDCPGFIMAVGNHIPPNTPVQAALDYNERYLETCMR